MSALNFSATTTVGARLFKWGIVLVGKRILQGITKMALHTSHVGCVMPTLDRRTDGFVAILAISGII